MDERPSELIDATRLLRGEFARLGGGFGIVLRAWRDAVGEHVARNAVPTSLRDGVLRVRCSTSTWSSELQLLAPEVLQRLREPLGQHAPTRLACYTGRVTTSPREEALQPPPSPLPPLPEGEKAAIRALVATLPDESVRQSVERAMESARRRDISRADRR